MILEPPRIRPVERVLFLMRIRWLAGLPPAELQLLADQARERSWPRGAELLRAGEPVGAVHLVVEGLVRLRRRGRELGCAAPGAAIGTRLLLSEDAAGVEAVALSDTVTLAVDRETFLDVLEERFALFRAALRETCHELVELFQRNPLEAAPAPPATDPRTAPGRTLDLVDRIVLLRSRPPFEAGSINALAELSQRLEEVQLPAGALLWRREEHAERMMFVAGGRVRCEPAQREATFTIGRGQPIGTLELLADEPRWYDAVVEEPATALVGGAEQLLDVFEDNVDMGILLLTHLTRSAVELEERVAERAGALPLRVGCESPIG